MKKLIISLSFLFSSLIIASGQDYENAVGARLGVSSGITFKHFFSSSDAVEGTMAWRWSGFALTGLYERHQGAFDVDRLYFYYGAGLHFGFYNSNPWTHEDDNVTVLGIDGIIGLEYVFTDIPFNIGIDWKPFANLIGYAGFYADEVALSFRFMF
jgi:hypothetical protein